MSELLLELLCEEIPARMQAAAARDLKRLILDGLAAAGLAAEGAPAFATPRRLAIIIDSLPARSAAVVEERKGPRVGAPEPAIQGFLKAAGLTSIAAAEIVKDAKKGDHYVARTERPGQPAAAILSELIPAVIAKLPWEKSMRWGDGNTRWVRPLKSILCLLDGRVVAFAIEGLKSGKTTRGHRFLGHSGRQTRQRHGRGDPRLRAGRSSGFPHRRRDAHRRGRRAACRALGRGSP